MFTASAPWYDLIYSQFKDYRAEAAAVAAIVRAHQPRASTVLDVGCGTGEHARYLTGLGFVVDGIDLEPAFVEIAATKVPGARFFQGDMTTFSLGTCYDAVVCLFSAIGYVREASELRRAIHRFREHLNPGGVIIVEPWFEPEQWLPGRFDQNIARTEDLLVCRVSHSGVHDRLSVVTFHYLVATARGIEHVTERHELGLFTRAEMMQAFADEGLAVEHQDGGLMGRGLYVAVAP